MRPACPAGLRLSQRAGAQDAGSGHSALQMGQRGGAGRWALQAPSHQLGCCLLQNTLPSVIIWKWSSYWDSGWGGVGWVGGGRVGGGGAGRRCARGLGQEAGGGWQALGLGPGSASLRAVIRASIPSRQ